MNRQWYTNQRIVAEAQREATIDAERLYMRVKLAAVPVFLLKGWHVKAWRKGEGDARP